jgi:hypothetical protein
MGYDRDDSEEGRSSVDHKFITYTGGCGGGGARRVAPADAYTDEEEGEVDSILSCVSFFRLPLWPQCIIPRAFSHFIQGSPNYNI